MNRFYGWTICYCSLVGLTLSGCENSQKNSSSDDTDTSTTSDSDSDSGGDVDTDSSTGADDAGADTDSDSQNGCTGVGLAAGDHELSLQHGGAMRSYLVHVPPGVDSSQPIPLVLNFHGYRGNMYLQQMFAAMDPVADAHGFVVAYPNGLINASDGYSSWNAGDCCAFGDDDRDDIGFTRAVVQDLSTKLCIDSKRIYVTGMSNGGFMAHYLACQAADLFAAAASVAGVLGVTNEQCNPVRPIPIIHFHGTADERIPYDGGTFRSVPDTIDAWRSIDGCDGEPIETLSEGQARCETYQTCLEGSLVTLCTIEEMGHCWPGQSLCLEGSSNIDISASEVMWSFYSAFTLP